MRLCRFDGDRLGLVEGDVVRDVTAAIAAISPGTWPFRPGDPLIANLQALRTPIAVHALSARAIPLRSVTLHSPITTPSKIMAAPVNYRLHVEIDVQDPAIHHGVHLKELEGVERPVEKLGLFLKAASSLVGPADGVRLVLPDRRTDYEAELVIVIGQAGRNIAARDAYAHIAGYCVGLDMSVRGPEERSFRKSADSYTVIGPWLTTAEEIADPQKLDLWLTLNGVPRQRSSTAAMTVGIPRLIEIASSIYTLHPGDLLMTGTPEGVGAVAPGDTIVAGCEGLGEFTVKVSAADGG
jgi:2,4-didehydro-3-deoxy-L-rhamnonate hydrolase